MIHFPKHRIFGCLFLAAIFAVSCGKGDEYAQEYYRLGREKREAGEPVQAMQYFINATQSRTHDYKLLGRVYSNMANMCRQAERHEMAYEIYTLSTEHFALAKDTLAVAFALNNMAWEQAVLGHKDSALMLIDSAVSVCPSEMVQSKVIESHAAACLYAAEYDSAIWYALNVADTLYGEMLLAQAYAYSEQYDSAIFYATHVAAKTTNPRYLDDAYYILAHCDSTAGRTEVVELSEKRTDVQRELEQYKSEMAQAVVLLQQSRNKRPFYPWCLILTILLSLSIVTWLSYKWLQIRKKRKIKQIATHLLQSKDAKREIPWNLYDLPSKLQERGLSEREIRIATLVMFGFSYAQMADILNRAENGIGKDKYLIAKKLGVSVKDLQNAVFDIACRN